MCTLPLLAGENASDRFVVPTVATAIDLGVHLEVDRWGGRRVREIVGVPGRGEGGLVETSDLFHLSGGALVRVEVFPPHSERFERGGYELAALLQVEACNLGAVIGLLGGAGLFCLWWAWWTPEPLARPSCGGWTDTTADLLAHARITAVSPSGLLGVCGGEWV